MVFSKQNGFILIVVMIFIQVLSLFSLYNIFSAKSYFKISNDTFNRLEMYFNVVTILNHLDVHHLVNSACQIDHLTNDDLIKKSDDWWLRQACQGHLQLINYFYVLEFLNTDTCAITKQGTAPSFYRIVLRFLNSENERLLFQETFSLDSGIKPSCDHPVYFKHQIFSRGEID